MNARRQFGLSKSKIAKFEQCPKRLWLDVHRPELAEVDAAAETRFTVGHEVGTAACALLPKGRMIEAEPDLAAALTMTRRLLDDGYDGVIFEATLEHDGVLVRIDILEPDGEVGWRIAEVKSATSVKDYHFGDLATQVWVARKAGLLISGAGIRHINKQFVLRRPGKHKGLFDDAECLADLEPVVAKRARIVKAARDILGGDEPTLAPGEHCTTPFACEFSAYCNSAMPAGPEWPVTDLPYGGGKHWLAQGITNLFEIDSDALTNMVHQRVYAAVVSGKPQHDAAGARAAMKDWSFPRMWLDFETIAFAVPRWVGTRPYQQIPFQFSAHVEAEDGTIRHREFLSLDGDDPRRACAEALIATAPRTGSVIGYNASFEKRCITELATSFPELGDQLTAIANRVVDLLPVARAHWYHRDQHGSWSIKAVLPTIAPDLNYAGLEVKDGARAQEAYLEAIAPQTTKARRKAIDHALRAYCKRDTEAMMVIARRLARRRSGKK